MSSLYNRVLGQGDGSDTIEPESLRAILVLMRQPSPEYTVLQATARFQLVDDQPAELQAILDTMPVAEADRGNWAARVVSMFWLGRLGDQTFNEEGIKTALGVPVAP